MIWKREIWNAISMYYIYYSAKLGSHFLVLDPFWLKNCVFCKTYLDIIIGGTNTEWICLDVKNFQIDLPNKICWNNFWKQFIIQVGGVSLLFFQLNYVLLSLRNPQSSAPHNCRRYHFIIFIPWMSSLQYSQCLELII